MDSGEDGMARHGIRAGPSGPRGLTASAVAAPEDGCMRADIETPT
jgi:hypothetical protein